MARRPTIISPRLELRPLDESAADALHAMWTTAEVRAFLWDGEVVPEAETHRMIRRSLAMFSAADRGLWGVYPRRDQDRLIGFAGFWHFRDQPELELLYGLDPDHWGRGFATESADAVIWYGFEYLGMAEIRGSADAPNTASRRVMERLGMARDHRDHGERSGTAFYRIERDDWHALAAYRVTWVDRPSASFPTDL